jgi:hypothetical protein
MASRDQIKIIHALKGALELDEGTYRGLVSGYGAESSKDLSVEKARELIDWLTQQAVSAGVWTNRKGKKGRPYEHLAGRDPEMASPAQLRMIAAIWAEVSYAPDAKGREVALRRFLGRFNCSAMEFLTKAQVSKVLTALNQMKRAADLKRTASLPGSAA